MEDSGFDSGDKIPFGNDSMVEIGLNDDTPLDLSHIKFRDGRNIATSSRDNKKTGPSISLSSTNTCKILQRKLELKVERAKRNYSQLEDTSNDNSIKLSKNLIPIERIPFPRPRDTDALVDVKCDNDSDSETEEVFFNSNKFRKAGKQELSDTFSIQDMSMDICSDGSESPSLEFLSPSSMRKSWWRRLWQTCCCIEH